MCYFQLVRIGCFEILMRAKALGFAVGVALASVSAGTAIPQAVTFDLIKLRFMSVHFKQS